MTRATPPDDAEDAPDEARPTDEAYIEELRERIARGDYRVDPEAIARRILERGGLEAAEEANTEGTRAEEPAPPALRLVGDVDDESGETDPADADDEPGDEPVGGVEEESGA